MTSNSQYERDSILEDTRAQSGQTAVGVVVMMGVGGIFMTFLGPIVEGVLAGTGTSSWSGGTVALWDQLVVILGFGILLMVIGMVK